MRELIVPLDWEYVDEMLNHIEYRLAAKQCPTILRMRTKAVVEELLSALLDAEGEHPALVRCIYPEPKRILIQYRNEHGTVAPDLTVLHNLLNNPCTYGVKAQFETGCCTITVGEK